MHYVYSSSMGVCSSSGAAAEPVDFGRDGSLPVADVTKRGIRLSYLIELSRSFDDEMTITQIVDKVGRHE